MPRERDCLRQSQQVFLQEDSDDDPWEIECDNCGYMGQHGDMMVFQYPGAYGNPDDRAVLLCKPCFKVMQPSPPPERESEPGKIAIDPSTLPGYIRPINARDLDAACIQCHSIRTEYNDMYLFHAECGRSGCESLHGVEICHTCLPDTERILTYMSAKYREEDAKEEVPVRPEDLSVTKCDLCTDVIPLEDDVHRGVYNGNEGGFCRDCHLLIEIMNASTETFQTESVRVSPNCVYGYPHYRVAMTSAWSSSIQYLVCWRCSDISVA